MRVDLRVKHDVEARKAASHDPEVLPTPSAIAMMPRSRPGAAIAIASSLRVARRPMSLTPASQRTGESDTRDGPGSSTDPQPVQRPPPADRRPHT